MGFGLIVAVLGLGSTFAANININGQDPNTEFGQGVTKTVFCGALEEPITVTPISKFVNESNYQRMTAPEVRGQSEVSYTYRFATSVNTSSNSDFISSNQATKVINGRTGVWLTDNGSDGQIASNQDETTFSSSNRSNYVFSQNATTKRINSSDVRGFYKVNNTTSEKIVITPAIASRSAQYTMETNPTEFYFNGVVISDIPESCEGKNFIISGFGQTGEALPLIIEDDEDDSIEEITALWTGNDDDDLKVSKSRLRFDNISSDLEEASQDDDRLEIVFGAVANYSRYQTTAALYRLVIETQEDTLSNGNNGGDNDGD
jgi:hypothetical protein